MAVGEIDIVGHIFKLIEQLTVSDHHIAVEDNSHLGNLHIFLQLHELPQPSVGYAVGQDGDCGTFAHHGHDLLQHIHGVLAGDADGVDFDLLYFHIQKQPRFAPAAVCFRC